MVKKTHKEVTTRLAIIDPSSCKPSRCNLECKKSCPVNKIGKPCITVSSSSPASTISEILCIGCGACAKKCPFNAIKIINLPSSSSFTKDVSHRYTVNGFILHRLPVPKLGSVLALVGTNGIGKSTALKILEGSIKPNLGVFDMAIDWITVLKKYKGSELHGFFVKVLGGEMKAVFKQQYVDNVPGDVKKVIGSDNLTVRDVVLFYFKDKSVGVMKNIVIEKGTRYQREKDLLISKNDTNCIKNDNHDFKENKKENIPEFLIEKFTLKHILDRSIDNLSGGELQRLSILITCLQKADIYFFDEPSSYLDIKQRLTIANCIRNTLTPQNYIVCVEHDLAICDLMCDYGCVLYGEPSAYGVITTPFSIKQAINVFLEGFVPGENMRFRSSALKFNVAEKAEIVCGRDQFEYNDMVKSYYNLNSSDKDTPDFILNVCGGNFSRSEIIVFMGENGTGKSTFINLISNQITPDNTNDEFPKLSTSIKPQKIKPKYKGTVKSLFMSKIRNSFLDSSFINEVIKPLEIEKLYDSNIINLSGGELQRVAITMCLGKETDMYLIDEPSAFLDADQRIAVCRVIKRFVYNRNKIAFVVEHDLIMGTYLADKIVVFEGTPGKNAKASKPMDLEEGMNMFLESLGVTFRRDTENKRPRVNKIGSTKDREQKESGKYFFA